MAAPLAITRGAAISEDGLYRYSLTRSWAPDPETVELHRPVVWIALNPSTADGTVDDPTIRRCVGFTRAWGHCHLTVANLYAFRATDPVDLVDSAGAGIDIVGPRNDEVLIAAAQGASLAIAAWGAHPFAARRAEIVLSLIDPADGSPLAGSPVSCLGRTKAGHPRHPLYVKGDTALEVLHA